MISIDPRLLNDGEVLGKFELSHVLLMRDANYPWCVLIPDREGKTEVFELSQKDQEQLQHEPDRSDTACLHHCWSSDVDDYHRTGSRFPRTDAVRLPDERRYGPVIGHHPQHRTAHGLFIVAGDIAHRR